MNTRFPTTVPAFLPDDALLRVLHHVPGANERIAHIERLPARPARFAVPERPLPPTLEQALASKGIDVLYAHQAAALDASRGGEHVGIVTATASGKTLCYQLPVIERVLHDARDRALMLFPTKALAHDQLRSLNGLLAGLDTPLSAATLDGDTPRPERDTIRALTQIVLSNPDMLHRSILPDHRRWGSWLGRLRFVVLDEAHTYRGVFGTHVALILRRLQRLCAHYGSTPQFICCSATSANPSAHLAALVGAPVQILDADGAPQGERTFVFWNPPSTESPQKRTARDEWRGTAPESSGGKRRSTNVETAHLLAALVSADIKTLTFARSRRGAELVLRYAREAIGDEQQYGLPLQQRLASYRAGYRPDERRELERAFLAGDVLGMISTNALELGVDIGGVDAVVMGGYPGTIASTWQQAGRAGRSQGSSLAVLVAQDDPLDQFYMRHPAQFFIKPPEQARIALQNPFILRDQLCCAAAELPLTDADSRWFGPTMGALRDWLVRHGQLIERGPGVVATSRWPSADVNIRNADGEPVMLRDLESGRVIEQIPATRAAYESFPGAVYLHQGDTYLIEQTVEGEAQARRATLSYYTQPRDVTDIAIERVSEERQIGTATLCFGVVTVTRQVTGYRRKQHYSEAVLSEHDLTMPPQTFRTQAVWWTLPDEMSAQIATISGDLPGALHAMEHAAIGLLPLFAQCDRWDIGGLSTALHPDTGLASVFVYDGVPGGVGIAQVGYEQAEGWWRATRDLLRDCPCAEGCPSCVQSPKCGSGNQPLSKDGALLLCNTLLGQAPSDAPVSSRTPEQLAALLADLDERLGRARREPPGVRRATLLIALRYKFASEQASLPQVDSARIQTQIAALERG